MNETDKEKEKPKEIELKKKPETTKVIKNGNKSITFEKVKPIKQDTQAPQQNSLEKTKQETVKVDDAKIK